MDEFQSSTRQQISGVIFSKRCHAIKVFQRISKVKSVFSDRYLWIFSLSGSLLKHRRGELGCLHLPNLQIQPENVSFYLFSFNHFEVKYFQSYLFPHILPLCTQNMGLIQLQVCYWFVDNQFFGRICSELCKAKPAKILSQRNKTETLLNKSLTKILKNFILYCWGEKSRLKHNCKKRPLFKTCLLPFSLYLILSFFSYW